MKHTILSALLLAGVAPIVAPAAHADDNPWQIRARVIGVMPDESGDLSAGGTALPGDVDIGDQYVPELDILVPSPRVRPDRKA